MKTLLHVDLTFDQVLDIVKQLPPQQKLLLTEALEKEAVDNRLSRLLQSFRTDELDWDTLTQEVESVRQELYEKQTLLRSSLTRTYGSASLSVNGCPG